MARRNLQRACQRPPREGSPSAGIALLVVMIAFVVLYLVVYQLHFSTTMEERIAQVRYGDVESAIALQSTALYVMTLLVEDLKSSMSQASQATQSGASGAGASPMAGGGPAGGGAGGASTGNFTSLLGGAGGATGGSKWYDYEHKNIFSPNEQQVGETTVKIRIRDGESRLDLNHLFDYPRLETEDIVEGSEDIREEDLVDLAGTNPGDAQTRLQANLLRRSERSKTGKSSKSSSTASASKTKDTGSEGAVAEVGAGADEEDPVAEAMSEYDPEEEFIPPDGARLQATVAMVERAVLMMFSINENEYGYRYAIRYSASEIAQAIVDYVIERRTSAYQNRIYLVSELLNIPGITREVFYGPIPELKDGEEMELGNGFLLRRDEFGDVVPEYMALEGDPYLEEQRQMMEDLQRQFGQLRDFPGLGRLQSNALTRGMSEAPVEIDEFGYEHVVPSPEPIGLKDIFTTFSTGKVNINTASAPVIFSLLLSLTEDEANIVALDLRDYRNRFQEEIDPEGVEEVADSQSPDLGQPKRVRKETEDSEALGSTSGTYDSMDPESTVAPYEDLETNYFTTLQQLELIDGTDGGPQDQLSKDEGVEKVDAQDDTLFRRVINDLEKVAVFGSTYFEAELKAKGKDGGIPRAGYLTVRRDPTKKRIEVLMWKNLQK